MENSANDLLLNGKSQSKIDIAIDTEKTRYDEDYASKYNDKKFITPKLVFSLFSAVVGSAFQFGYNTGVINSPAQIVRHFINETYYNRYNMPMNLATIESLWAFTVAIFAVGGCIGGLSNGFFADKLGRKKSLMLNNILGIIGGLLMGLSKPAKSYEMIIIGRFIIGLNCGLNSGLCPMYINEIAPKRIRGSIGVLFQLGVTFSIFFSQIFGLPEIFGNEKLWSLLLGFTATFSVFQLIALPFCPESPRFLLIKQDKSEEAQRCLKILRGSSDVKEEMDEMIKEASMEKNVLKFSIFQLFRVKTLALPITISIVLHLSQQLSGINAVFYYSSDILKNSGIENATYATPFIGLIMVIMTIVSLPLMERKGRRFLHLLGLGGMFIFSILMTIAFVLQNRFTWLRYLSIVSMMLYIVFFAIGPGSIPWLIVAELFSQGPRSAAVSVAVMVNWSANVAVGQGFPPLFQNVTKEWTFLLFTVFLLFFFIFTFCFLPETKNKTPEQITNYFNNNTFAFKQNTTGSNVEIKTF